MVGFNCINTCTGNQKSTFSKIYVKKDGVSFNRYTQWAQHVCCIFGRSIMLHIQLALIR